MVYDDSRTVRTHRSSIIYAVFHRRTKVVDGIAAASTLQPRVALRTVLDWFMAIPQFFKKMGLFFSQEQGRRDTVYGRIAPPLVHV